MIFTKDFLVENQTYQIILIFRYDEIMVDSRTGLVISWELYMTLSAIYLRVVKIKTLKKKLGKYSISFMTKSIAFLALSSVVSSE